MPLISLFITKTCPCIIQIFFSAQKPKNFHQKKFDISLIFAPNIDCGYTLELPRRGDFNKYPQSMFGAKIRKIGTPLYTPVLLFNSGVSGGIHYTACFLDVKTPPNWFKIIIVWWNTGLNFQVVPKFCINGSF